MTGAQAHEVYRRAVLLNTRNSPVGMGMKAVADEAVRRYVKENEKKA